MSEGNGKAQRKKYSKRIKTQEVDIEDDDGNVQVYTLKQMTGEQVSEFEKWRAPLLVDGKPTDGAVDLMMNYILTHTMYDPSGMLVTQDFVKSLSLEAKMGLSSDAITLSGIKDVKAEKEEAKNV